MVRPSADMYETSTLTEIAFGPLFLGPLSEIYGRSRVLQLANLWYLGMRSPCDMEDILS